MCWSFPSADERRQKVGGPENKTPIAISVSPMANKHPVQIQCPNPERVWVDRAQKRRPQTIPLNQQDRSDPKPVNYSQNLVARQ
jgi:hypothetical protein